MISQLSLFLNESSFFCYYLQKPGGLLSYVGQFFSQLLLYPIVGCCVIIIFLFLLQQMVMRLFRLHGIKILYSFLPSLILIFSVSTMGEMLFLNIHGDFLFSTLIGWNLVIGLLLITDKRRKNGICFHILTATGAAMLLYIGGFYGVEATVLLFTRSVCHNDTMKKIKISVIYLVVFVLFFLMAYFCLYKEYPLFFPLFEHLKNYPWHYGWLPQMLEYMLFGGLLLVLLVREYQIPLENNRYVNVILLVCVLFISGYCIWRGNMMETRCEMLMATQHNDWKKVIKKAARRGASEPLIYLALAKENRLLDEMFHYVNIDSPYHLFETPNEQSSIVNIEVLRGIGLFYFSYHLTYENMIFRSPSYYNYKQLGELSVINKEYSLAQKYGTTLSHSWLWKKEAKILMTALHDEYKGFDEERQWQPKYDYLSSVFSNFESLLLYNYAQAQRNKISVQYGIASLLVQKKLDLLDQWLQILKEQGYSTIPEHVQEAVALWSILKSQSNTYDSWIQPRVKIRLDQFLRLAKSAKDVQTAKKLTESFKHTYWYYYTYAPEYNKEDDNNATYDQR